MPRIKVTDMESAWTVAKLVFPTKYTHDDQKSSRNYCAVYVSTAEGYDGFEIHEHENQLWVYLGDCNTVQIDVTGASPSETKALFKANKRIAELEEYKGRLVKSEYDMGMQRDEARDRAALAELRVKEAEAETMQLKAKLYDILIEGKG